MKVQEINGRNTETQQIFWNRNLEKLQNREEENSDVNVHSVSLFLNFVSFLLLLL